MEGIAASPPHAISAMVQNGKIKTKKIKTTKIKTTKIKAAKVEVNTKLYVPILFT